MKKMFSPSLSLSQIKTSSENKQREREKQVSYFHVYHFLSHALQQETTDRIYQQLSPSTV
jgi:hypothetical protein